MSAHPLTQAVESILFVSTKPLSVKKLALHLNAGMADVREALHELATDYSQQRGILLVVHDDTAQLVTHPAQSESVRTYAKIEHTGDLTRSAVETLSIIAYRGPIAKEDIEQIRGVHCSIALRNLSIRGLIEAVKHTQSGKTTYRVTFDFLQHLGLTNLKDLPEYGHFHDQIFCADSPSIV